MLSFDEPEEWAAAGEVAMLERGTSGAGGHIGWAFQYAITHLSVNPSPLPIALHFVTSAPMHVRQTIAHGATKLICQCGSFLRVI